MTDEQLRRRRTDTSLDRRVTVLEVEMRNHTRASEALHRDQTELLAKLDQRADRQDIVMARLLAVLSVVMIIGQVLAPLITKLLFGVSS